MSPNYREIYQNWLDNPALGEDEWQELNAISEDDKEIEDRFYSPLDFGTAGIRGVMGAGLRRMNIHVVRHATQAFASVILDEGAEAADRGVVIGYDCRINSQAFARECASVFAGNGVKVRIFDSLRPTPELSFAIRHYGATAGLNITASHNPKEYNGYKAYWSDGAQLPPDHAESISGRMREMDIFTSIKRMDFDEAVQSGYITVVGEECDELFLNAVLSHMINPDAVKRAAPGLKIVFTPFHGAGHILVPEALKRLGVTGLFTVPEQMAPDGEFPTVKNPNPEDREGFALAEKLAAEVGARLIIGTDPDTDRVGVLAADDGGAFTMLTGNQVGALLLDYIISARREKGTLPQNAATIKSIVTTELAREIAERNGVRMDDTFTGFKFMAERIAENELSGEFSYIFSFEESIGYMVGEFVRDKDAVTTSALIAEMAAYYMNHGRSLLDALDGLFEKYGWHAELTKNLVMPGIEGLKKMRALMDRLREDPPLEIAGEKVLLVRDYLSGKVRVSGVGVVENTDISGSDVLFFELADRTSFIVRPSGTEPKIKVYILVKGSGDADCREKMERYGSYAESLQNG